MQTANEELNVHGLQLVLEAVTEGDRVAYYLAPAGERGNHICGLWLAFNLNN